VAIAEFLNDNWPDVSSQIRRGFTGTFDSCVTSCFLKGYKDKSQDSYYCDHPRSTFDMSIFKILSGEVEPAESPSIPVCYVAFDLVFAKSNLSYMPEGNFQGGEPAPFLVVEPPWEIILQWADKKEQATQVRFRFRAFVNIRFANSHRSRV
jgi:hypothetical protein